MNKMNAFLVFALLILGSCKKFSAEHNPSDGQLISAPVGSYAIGDEPMIGYATEAGGTTGGDGGPTVTVTNYTDLKNALTANDSAKIVVVSGTITGNMPIFLKSNKTLTSTNGATLRGISLIMANDVTPVHNVIIRNLKIEDVRPDSIGGTPRDCITIKHGTHHVWVDHCELSTPVDHDWENDEEYYDELMEVTRGSDYVTVSWTKFLNSWKGILISGSSSETENIGKLHVTLHHNYFYNILERAPFAGFGHVHVFNNYFRNDYVTGHIGYSVRTRDGANIRVENNYFDNTVPGGGTNTSIPIISGGSNSGYITGDTTNIYVNTVSNSISSTPGSYTVPYSYNTYLTAASAVPTDVLAGAGTFTAPSLSITTHPASQTISIGSSGSLSVTATGSGLSYQWKKNGTNISGATSSTLNFSSISASDQASYTVVVSNSSGSVTSNAAVLTVNLVKNSGFESDFTSWDRTYGSGSTINTSSSNVYGGAKSLASGPSAGDGRGQTITSGFTVGSSYTLGVWAKVSTTSGADANIEIQYRNSGGSKIAEYICATVNSTTFQHYTFTQTVPTGTASIAVIMYNNGGKTCYTDNWTYTKN